jgi:hypothetical protein
MSIAKAGNDVCRLCRMGWKRSQSPPGHRGRLLAYYSQRLPATAGYGRPRLAMAGRGWLWPATSGQMAAMAGYGHGLPSIRLERVASQRTKALHGLVCVCRCSVCLMDG